MKTQNNLKFYNKDMVSNGNRLEIKREIWGISDQIEQYAQNTEKQLQKLLEDSKEKENEIIAKIKLIAEQWEEQAATTNAIQAALEYLNTATVEHTNNQWSGKEGYENYEEISNNTYKMYVRFYTYDKYCQDLQKHVPYVWYVSYGVLTNSPNDYYHKKIAGQQKKRFTDETAAMKYIAGRKKAYAHLFKELTPPVPAQYAEHFKVNGVLLPGYTIEK